MENQTETATPVLVNPSTEQTLEEKAKAFEGELDALAENYGVNILAAVSFKKEDNTGVFYSGEQNLITELGLAKVIENKFRN